MQVLSMIGDNPVIFAPSHRSYGDFILMSYLCFHYKIQIPAIAAGMGKQMHDEYCIDMLTLPGPKYLTLILRRSRMGTVWFYTSTSNKRAA